MRLDPEDGSLLLSESELAAIGQRLGHAPTDPAAIPAVEVAAEEAQAALSAFEALAEPERGHLSKAVGALVAPRQLCKLHYTIADESVSRAFLAP